MVFLLGSSAVAGIVYALALLLVDVYIWPQQTRAGAAGAALATAWPIIALLLAANGWPEAALALLVVLVTGHTIVALATIFRERLADADQAAFRAGQASAPLTQDDIDQGGPHASST